MYKGKHTRGSKPKSLEEHLLRYREIRGNCWIWTRRLNNKGYGIIKIDKWPYLVHRVSAMLYLGLDLNNNKRSNQVNHKLECKSTACFNPAHLYIGSQSSNMADRHLKVRTANEEE